jgi:hypothetical protein
VIDEVEDGDGEDATADKAECDSEGKIFLISLLAFIVVIVSYVFHTISI